VFDVLGSNLPKEYQKAFTEEIVHINLTRSKVMAFVIFIIEVILLLISYLPSIASLYGNSISRYRLFYFVIIMYVICYIVIIHITTKSKIIGNNFIMPYIRVSMGVFLGWSMLITLVDQARDLQSFVYLFISLAISVIMITPPVYSMIIYAFVHGLYISLNFIIGLPKETVFSNLVNTTSVIITSWIISVLLYRNLSKDFIKRQIILEQTKALEQAVILDPLTHLYNRRGLDEMLNQYFESAISNQSSLLVIMMDIDYFKGLNDTYGHSRGDEALIIVSNHIKAVAEKVDGFACRYGGDEILLVTMGYNELDMEKLILELKHIIENECFVNSTSLVSDYLTISVGGYLDYPTLEQQPWDYIRKSDEVLYKSKHTRLIQN